MINWFQIVSSGNNIQQSDFAGNIWIGYSGQSNAVGAGLEEDMPSNQSYLLQPLNVQVWNGSSYEQLNFNDDNHQWPLKPETINAVLNLGYLLRLKYPLANIYFAQRAYNGTKIEEWLSGGAYYDSMNAWWANSLTAISANPNDYRAFFVWDQGESDGDNEVDSLAYGTNLTALIQHYRSYLNVNLLPFIARKQRYDVSENFPYIANVIDQQESITENYFHLINSESSELILQDGIHFDTPSQNRLAELYFNEIINYIE
jgi:hypothetical protein